MQLLDSDWPANILNFQAQENQLMSPDGVCTIRVGMRLLKQSTIFKP